MIRRVSWRSLSLLLAAGTLLGGAAEARPKAKPSVPPSAEKAPEKKALPSKPPVEGFWDTPAGRVEIQREGKQLTGSLVAPADGVKLNAGQKVLQGIFDDDNVSADLRLELVSPKCRDDSTKAFAVLLLTRSGKLTGGVSSPVSCAAEVSAISFVRSADQARSAKVAAKTDAVPGAGQYNAKGKRAVAMDKTIRALMDAGFEDLQNGQFEKARGQFEKVIANAPNVGEAYNGVGVTYAMRNDYETAIDWYKKGLEVAPGFGDLYYNLACAYAQLSKKSMALRYFRLAVTKGYAEVDAIDSDHDLDSLREEPEFVALRKQLGGEKAATKPSSENAAP